MGVAFEPGKILARGDLDIFTSNSAGNAANAAAISFAIYYVDPGTGSEVLIGDPLRTPVNPSVGEYYAAIMVPAGASPGAYRIRWTFRELSNYPDQMVVQEFAVVNPGSTTIATGVDGTAPNMSVCEADLVKKLRFLTRDNCVGAEELIEVDVDGEILLIRMDDLYEAVHS